MPWQSLVWHWLGIRFGFPGCQPKIRNLAGADGTEKDGELSMESRKQEMAAMSST